MAERFQQLVPDPRRNPAVLDTGTWAPSDAWRQIRSVPESYWTEVAQAVNRRDPHAPLPARDQFRPFYSALSDGALHIAAELADGQRVFVSLGPEAAPATGPLSEPIGTTSVGNATRLSCFPTEIETVKRFVDIVARDRGPRALGSAPRLGIGCRMTVAGWPGIWRAMNECGFAANAIQNSLRELRLGSDVRRGIPPRENYQFSFGTVQEGHTGSTFEGLWLEGVLSALSDSGGRPYGADADHIMVKRAEDGLQRAREIVDAARHYTFFTLDVSDLLDYRALSGGTSGTGREYLEVVVPDATTRAFLLNYHRKRGRNCGHAYNVYEETMGRLVRKYWHALEAVEKLGEHLVAIKKDAPFDLEISIDENPPDVRTCDSVTTEAEMLFLIFEAQRRHIPVSHIAPNFGVEKGVDYRCPDGLDGLARRGATLGAIAEDYDLMLDCHSGDDLSRETVRCIAGALRGRLHFKVSPSLQTLFGRAMHETDQKLFEHWWDLSMAFALEKSEQGSELARAAVAEATAAGAAAKRPDSAVFHHFSFAPVGKVDAENHFVNRDWFYSLPRAVYDRYTVLMCERLCELAEDLFEN